MLNSDTELIFPTRLIPHLRNLRGELWQAVIDKVINNQDDIGSKMGMVILMSKLAGCLTCNADSYRAIRGCTICSQQALKRYKGSDKDLETYFNKSVQRANKYLQKRTGILME